MRKPEDKPEVQGKDARITSDAGLLACRELDEVLGLTKMAPEEEDAGIYLSWRYAFWDAVCDGKTFYEAMLEANSRYPLFIDNVVFTGDRSVKLR